jgi:hypothetical protein
VTANADRVLFGNSLSNVGTDHSAALGSITTASDKMTANSIHLMKRVARGAYPRVTPYMTDTGGREYYLVFTHPRHFRDLKKDTTIAAARRDALDRGEKNPIFQDGDIVYDGMIFREIPELEWAKNSSSLNTETTLEGVGDSSSDVAASFLCGTQALCYANKAMPSPTVKKEDDYGFFSGVGIEMAHGIRKLTWNNGDGNARTSRKDFGMVTMYFSASADA